MYIAKWQNNNWIVRNRFSSIFSCSPAEIAFVEVKELDARIGQKCDGETHKIEDIPSGESGFCRVWNFP